MSHSGTSYEGILDLSSPSRPDISVLFPEDVFPFSQVPDTDFPAFQRRIVLAGQPFYRLQISEEETAQFPHLFYKMKVLLVLPVHL